MECYNIVDIESGKDYKPVRKSSINSEYYQGLPILKFLCASAPSCDVKIWTIGVDTKDDKACITVPASAFTPGNVYEIAVGKMEFSGGKFIGYMSSTIPLNFPY